MDTSYTALINVKSHNHSSYCVSSINASVLVWSANCRLASPVALVPCAVTRVDEREDFKHWRNLVSERLFEI